MHPLRSIGGLGAGLLVLSVGSATASPFVTLPREDGASNVGIDLSLTPTVDFGFGEVSAFRLEPYGEYALSDQLVVYGNVPLSHASGDGESETALGGLELGVGITLPTNNPDLLVIATAGLVLPTAPDDDASIANAVAGYGRAIDILDAVPKLLGPRLNGTAIYRSGQLIAQGSVGAEGGYYTGDNFDTDDVGPLLHVGVGLAYDAGAVTLGGELASVYNTDNGADSDDTLSTIAFSARAPFGDVTAYGALVMPLESEVRDFVPVVFTVGAEFRLPAR